VHSKQKQGQAEQLNLNRFSAHKIVNNLAFTLNLQMYIFSEMDELEISVSENELREFNRDHVRDIWNPLGMVCPVEECVSKHGPKKYVKLGRYLDHWSQVHASHMTLHQCDKCKKSFTKRYRALEHMKSAHTSVLLEKLVENKNYIDPGDVVPPRPGSKAECEQERRKARDAAARQRKSEIENRPPLIICDEERISSTTTRDEEFVLTQNGGYIRRKKSWLNAARR